MADIADCLGACCGICCICGAASAESWLTLSRSGCCGGSGNAGCCGSCCKKSLNDDDFEEQVVRDMEKTKAADASVVATQPTGKNSMLLKESRK